MNENIFKQKSFIAVVSLIVLGGVAFAFFNTRSGDIETIVVQKADYVQEISVSGKVIAANNVDLAFSQSGRIGDVFVKVGDVVSKDAVLASIENNDVEAEILQKRAALEAARVKLADLKRGSRPEKIEISRAKVASAQVAHTEALQSLEEKISDAFIKSDDAVRIQADQFFSNPNSLNPQILFETDSQLEQDIASRRVALGQDLVLWNTQITEKQDIETLAQDSLVYVNLVKIFLEKAALALSTLDASSTLSQTTIDGWKSDISSARTTVSTATSNLVSAIGDVSSAQSALLVAEKELLLEEAGVTQEDIDQQEAQIKVAEADLASARARFEKTLVAAPFDGVISKMDAKIGGIASANTSLISMISAGKFHIESFVPEINSTLIKVGDVARVTLDAYGSREIFRAQVIATDPAETIRDGVSTYKATFEFSVDDERIKPGMTANITVTTEEKKDVVAVPQGIVFDRGDEQFVFIKQGESITERKVETGSVFSLGDIEIISGLTEGDMVVLDTEQ